MHIKDDFKIPCRLLGICVPHNPSSHNYCCKESFRNPCPSAFHHLGWKVTGSEADPDFGTTDQAWRVKLQGSFFSTFLWLTGKPACGDITQNREFVYVGHKVICFQKAEVDWDCKCNRIFDSHSSTPFPDNSNDRYYSLLELDLTHFSQSDTNQQCQHRMVFGLFVHGNQHLYHHNGVTDLHAEVLAFLGWYTGKQVSFCRGKF